LIKLTNTPEEDNDIQFTYVYHVYIKLGLSHHQFMFIRCCVIWYFRGSERITFSCHTL